MSGEATDSARIAAALERLAVVHERQARALELSALSQYLVSAGEGAPPSMRALWGARMNTLLGELATETLASAPRMTLAEVLAESAPGQAPPEAPASGAGEPPPR